MLGLAVPIATVVRPERAGGALALRERCPEPRLDGFLAGRGFAAEGLLVLGRAGGGVGLLTGLRFGDGSADGLLGGWVGSIAVRSSGASSARWKNKVVSTRMPTLKAAASTHHGPWARRDVPECLAR
ncbi:MAG: hypothetical protein CSB46_09590 [Micrococcales bacterium]|nr:MAG: hypothetical protein CSB46_09590 [Micrococcales bacterium]